MFGLSKSSYFTIGFFVSISFVFLLTELNIAKDSLDSVVSLAPLGFEPAAAAAASASASAPPPPPPIPPSHKGPLNILIIYPDDMRYDSIQDERGPDFVKTPFLSELAAQGMRFPHNSVTSSICWISRATLFTGQYASQHGSLRLQCPRFTLPQYWNTTWVSLLQRFGGYFVGHVGKWQFSYGEGMNDLFNWTHFHEGGHWYREKGKNIHGATYSRDKAVEFLRHRPKDQPFALTVALYPPKAVGSSYNPGGQWMPKNETKKLYENITYVPPYNFEEASQSLPGFLKNRGPGQGRFKERWNSSLKYQVGMTHYHALITEVDQATQEIVEELKHQGVFDNTLIIFTSDNGLLTGNHGLAGKWNPYEESIRVPLIVYDPRMAKSKHGTLDDSFTLNIDLASTILGAAQLEPDPQMQGRDISDLYLVLKDGKDPLEDNPWRQDFYYEFPLEHLEQSEALVQLGWKYMYWARHKFEQLFHLTEDPYELKDLLREKSRPSSIEEKLQQMRVRFKELREQMIEPNKTRTDWCNKTLKYP